MTRRPYLTVVPDAGHSVRPAAAGTVPTDVAHDEQARTASMARHPAGRRAIVDAQRAASMARHPAGRRR